MTPGLLIDHVTRQFPGGVVAVDDVTLEVASDEFLVLVGPSGCGKSTLLRLVAGLESVTTGRICMGNDDITLREPKDRDIAMVFQDYALYPHMTVAQNMGFGLRLRKTPRPEIRRRVNEAAHMLGLESLLARKPAQLSGGQRQRVAMGRAIVREPRAFLMDEPLSNLDAKLRVQMRGELALLRERLRTTTIYVTHDQVEAMTLGKRVAVMSEGRIQQVDRPQALYNHPVNLFVAAFIGSPAMNLVEAVVSESHVSFGGLQVSIQGSTALRDYIGGRVIVGIRPSWFQDATFNQDSDSAFIEVIPDVAEELGDEVVIFFTIHEPPVLVERIQVRTGGAVAPATTAEESDRSGRTTKFAAKLNPDTAARAGEPIGLTINHRTLHFFDPITHEAIGR